MTLLPRVQDCGIDSLQGLWPLEKLKAQLEARNLVGVCCMSLKDSGQARSKIQLLLAYLVVQHAVHWSLATGKEIFAELRE